MTVLGRGTEAPRALRSSDTTSKTGFTAVCHPCTLHSSVAVLDVGKFDQSCLAKYNTSFTVFAVRGLKYLPVFSGKV